MTEQELKKENLHRGLQERHIQLIAIGGAIGVGLFLGSRTAIQMAGPSLMVSYLIGGLVVYIIMRALGEIAVEHPVSGSFSTYAHMFINPCAGFITGWTYWLMWITTGMAEITAVGVYCHFWWPELPQWIPALAALACMTLVNLAAVKLFGEVEFWFSLIKVVTIVAMILAGIGIIFFGIGNGGEATGISNLYALDGGFMPFGVSGLLFALYMVMFAFLGVELIGVTAGEADNPDKTIPSAINKVMWRILVFYIGALFVIMSIFPWNEMDTAGSPFVAVFNGLGIGPAAAIINFVVMTAALSSCNSGIFSTGRMLYALSLQKTAPKIFSETNSKHIPAKAILFSSFCLLIGVILNYMVPEQVFKIVTSIATFLAIWVWGTILVIHMLSRKGKTAAELAKLKFPTFLYPFSNILAMVALILVCVILTLSAPDIRISMIIGPIWIILLIASYKIFYKKNKNL